MAAIWSIMILSMERAWVVYRVSQAKLAWLRANFVRTVVTLQWVLADFTRIMIPPIIDCFCACGPPIM